MFSSWISRVSSSLVQATSPKAILASYLASSLSQFFEVDVNQIESNLVSNTKIILKHVQLKPFPLNHGTHDGEDGDSNVVMILVGEVNEIVFSWTWGGSSNGSTSFIRETMLTIRGVRVRVKKQEGEGHNSLMEAPRPQQHSSTSQPVENNMGYIQRHIQQIIDHLKLNVTDVEIVVECGEVAANSTFQRACLVVEAKSLQLVSFGRESDTTADTVAQEDSAKPPLSQRISLNSIVAYVASTSAELEDGIEPVPISEMLRVPLMEPFGYAASVKRVAGRRFMDGIANGLEVVGEIVAQAVAGAGQHRGKRSKDTDRLVLHAGALQVKVMSYLANLLAPGTRAAYVCGRSESLQDDKPQDMPQLTSDDSTTNASIPSTTFFLPLPSVVLWLPNDCMIQMPNCTLQYHMDGSVFSLHGTEGIHVNGLHDFLRVQDTTRWLLDFARCKASLERQNHCDSKLGLYDSFTGPLIKENDFVSPMAQIQWDEVEMKKLLRGLKDVFSLVSADLGDEMMIVSSKSMSPTSPWSFVFDGVISVRVEGPTGWMNASVSSASVTMSLDDGGFPNDFKVGKVTVGPTSFGAFSIRLPTMVRAAGAKEALLQGAAQVDLQSLAVIDAVYQLASGAFDIDGLFENKAVLTQCIKPGTDIATSLPFSICIPKAILTLLEPNVVVEAEGTRIQDSTIQSEMVRVTSKDPDASASVAGMQATLAPAIKASFLSVQSLRVSGVVELAQPIHDMTVGFDDGILQVDLPLLRVIAPLLSSNLHKNTSQQHPHQVPPSPTLPFSIRFRVNELGVKLSKVAKSYVRLHSIDIMATPSNEAVSISACSSIGVYLQAPDKNWLKACISKFSVGLDPWYVLNEIKCSGIEIGPSSCGCVSVRVPSIASTSAMKKLHVADFIVVSLGSIDVSNRLQQMLSKVLELEVSPAKAASTNDLMHFPFAFTLAGLKVAFIEEKIKFELHGVKMEESTAQCASAVFNSNDMSATLSGALVTLGSSVIVQLHKVDDFHVRGLVALDESISDVTFAFKNGELRASCPSVSLIASDTLLHSTSKQSNVGFVDTTTLLPFPLRVHMDHLRMNGVGGKQGLSIQIHPIELVIFQEKTSLSVTNYASTAIHVESSCGEYLDLNMDEPTATMALTSEGIKPGAAKSGRIHIGPTSCGHLSVDSASFSMDSENIELSSAEVVNISLESTDVTNKLQAMFASVIGQIVPTSAGSAHSNTLLSRTIYVPEVKLKVINPSIELALKSIQLYESNLHCASLIVTEGSGMSTSVSYLEASLGNRLGVHVHRIETLSIPGGFYLHKPICSPRMVFMDGVLQLLIPSVSLVVMPTNPNAQKSKSTNQQPNEVIPFPVQLVMQEVDVKFEGEKACSAHLSQINVVAVPVDKAVSLENASPVTIRLQSFEGEWLESRINGFTAVLSPYVFFPSMVTCAGILVGPSSLGHISVQIPPFSVNDKLDISMNGTLAVALQSAEVAVWLQKLASSLMVSSGSPDQHASATVSGSVPKMTIDIAEPNARVILDMVSFNDAKVTCEKLAMTEASGMSACLSGISATAAPLIAGQVECIESLNIPNTFHLEKPVRHAKFSLTANNSLFVDLSSLHIVMLQASSKTSEVSICVPIPICLTLDELTMRASASSNESTRLQSLDCRVKPTPVDPFSQTQPSGAMFQIVMKSVENKLMKLQNTRVSGAVYSGQANVIHRLQVAVESLTIMAGFSIADWATMLTGEQKEATTVLMLPNSCVGPLQAKMTYKGTLVTTKETLVQIPRFLGDPRTTSNDVLQHITQSVLAKVPSFLVNAELLGENVVDMTAKQVGRVALCKTVTGSLGGSVVGLVAADSVRGIIASGKQSRSASENEGYRFGDFTRGLFHSMKQSAKTGGELRRGDDAREYSVGDFSTGAAHATGKYVVENKSRLAAAGGSGLGMTVGLALAGPAGWAVAGIAGVAGAYAGSKVGGSVFEDQNTEKVSSTPSEADIRRKDSSQLFGDNQSHPTIQRNDASNIGHCTSTQAVGQPPTVAPYQTGIRGAPVTNADVDLLGLGLASTVNSSHQANAQTPLWNIGSPSYGTEDLLGLRSVSIQSQEQAPFSNLATTPSDHPLSSSYGSMMLQATGDYVPPGVAPAAIYLNLKPVSHPLDDLMTQASNHSLCGQPNVSSQAASWEQQQLRDFQLQQRHSQQHFQQQQQNPQGTASLRRSQGGEWTNNDKNKGL